MTVVRYSQLPPTPSSSSACLVMPAAHCKDCLDEVKACMGVQSPQFSLPAEYWTASSRLQSYVTTLHHTLHTFTHMLPYYTIPHLMSSTICYLLCFFVASPCSVFCLKCFDDLHLSACMFLLSSCMFLLFRFIPSSLCIFDTISVSSPCLLVQFSGFGDEHLSTCMFLLFASTICYPLTFSL